MNAALTIGDSHKNPATVLEKAQYTHTKKDYCHNREGRALRVYD